jgi:pimeloyl-ACP methyl ester carboxylesterase/flagellar basal body-associated protein FliL
MRKVNKSHRKPVVRKSEVKRSHQIIEPMQSTDTHEIINNEDMEKPKKHRTWLVVIVILIFIVAMAALSFFVWKKYFDNSNKAVSPVKQVELTKPPEIQTGKIISTEPVQSFTAAQTLAQIKQTNKAFNLPVNFGYKKQTIRFNTSDGTSNEVLVYAKVYVPDNAVAQKTPVMSFATGTTGIGDICASSIEQPTKRNWANYDSQLAAYVSQGYIVVVTDYEGMRDDSRMHHYMVGELEGKVVLDSIQALNNLDITKSNVDKNAVFVAGYSQGGHAAYWADALATKYAPNIKIAGAVGFGPVTSVSETLTSAITNGANINWFGPFVISSYQDWYKRKYPVDRILLPKWINNLNTDVANVCIDNVNQFYPSNIGANRSSALYTTEFINAAKTGNIANNSIYAQFASDMDSNLIGSVKTDTPKLINHGAYDNVVLPTQSKSAYSRLCSSGNKTTLKEYTTSPFAVQTYNPKGLVDHYQTMNASLNDTITWFNEIRTGTNKPGCN